MLDDFFQLLIIVRLKQKSSMNSSMLLCCPVLGSELPLCSSITGSDKKKFSEIQLQEQGSVYLLSHTPFPQNIYTTLDGNLG